MKIIVNGINSFRLLAMLLVLAIVTGCGGSGSSGELSVIPDSQSSSSKASLGNEIGEDNNSSVAPLFCTPSHQADAMNLRIYQVMTEAFIDGDPAVGHGVGYGTSHHHGDLQGITQSLEYIKNLGFNAIWLTPLFVSEPLPGQDLAADRLDATGYYASNYFAIDPRFGSMDDARELVDTAHAMGLYVFFDGVFGHFKNNAHNYPSPTGQVLTARGESVAGTGRLAIYPEDLDFFAEVASYWVKELKIDGWRLDQAYQVPLPAWINIRRAVEEASKTVIYINAEGTEVHPLGYMVAEIWKGAESIATEAYGSEVNPALCSAFDFPMRYALVQALAIEENGAHNHTAARLRNGFNSHYDYPIHALPNGFLGNHDLLRFGDLLQRGNIANPTDDLYWKKHKAAYSFLAAYSGPITLYYGEEIGEQVPDYAQQVSVNCVDRGLCDDHVARTSGKVEGLPSGVDHNIFSANTRQASLRDHVRDLMHLRAQHPALYRGERTAITVPGPLAEVLYADYKSDADGDIIYLLNISNTPIEVSFESCALGSQGELTDLLGQQVLSPDAKGRYSFRLPASSSFFYQVEEPITAGPGCFGNSDPEGSGPLADCDLPDAQGDGPLNTRLYIRGTYAGGEAFSATPESRRLRYKGNNLYQVTVNEAAVTHYSFKFANADWRYEFAVLGGTNVALGAVQDMGVASGPGTESLIEIPEPGSYLFSVQFNDALDGGELMVSRCTL